MKEAIFYEKSSGNKVRCLLCPHFCTIAEGHSGICKVRKNIKGILYTEVYNQVAAIHSDPIEKKPLYHFYPGHQILSVGGIGCNLKCLGCQNSSISQVYPDDFHRFISIDAAELTSMAAETENNIGVAYTYNEPFTFYEFMKDCATSVRAAGLKNVAVSNGFVNPAPLAGILPLIDAFNIDLKAFNEGFYREYTGGRLAPVLETLKTISSGKKHLEITYLLIPGLNDDPEEFGKMADWIAKNTGEYTPLHISRYFPAYKMTNPPTPASTMEKFYEIAAGFLKYVFLGNISGQTRSATRCPACGKILIERDNYRVRKINLSGNSVCGFCQAETGITG